jgi:hypothetical protein
MLALINFIDFKDMTENMAGLPSPFFQSRMFLIGFSSHKCFWSAFNKSTFESRFTSRLKDFGFNPFLFK